MNKIKRRHLGNQKAVMGTWCTDAKLDRQLFEANEQSMPREKWKCLLNKLSPYVWILKKNTPFFCLSYILITGIHIVNLAKRPNY